jgi:para-aminobenzoate synthetase component 1
MSELLPVVEELIPAPDPEAMLVRFASRPHCIFFDSARRDPKLGRYSFLAAEPFEFQSATVDEDGALDRLEKSWSPFQATTVRDLPPFQGGAAGLFSYDLGRQFERLPAARVDEFAAPALACGLYDVVLAWDHVQNRAWLISQGFPETDPAARRERAVARLRHFRELIASPAPALEAATGVGIERLPFERLAPQSAIAQWPGLTSNFAPAEYLQTARRAVEYICAGDIFQVNLAQRLLYPANCSARELYLRLRHRNPATFAGYFDLGAMQIVSASPERFLSVFDRRCEARPIKGTRRRTWHPEADLFAGDDLMQSDKDRAENVMIVDLLRNDLSRVCDRESVRVTQLCRLESYEFVQHLVSAVEGTLRSGLSPLDALRAAFPGGSITGAPKIRAMEIIAELEPTARGAYCGSLAYVGFDGAMDASILIRTVTAASGWWQAPVGGGITAVSDPRREYEETWHKAEGMLRAFEP